MGWTKILSVFGLGWVRDPEPKSSLSFGPLDFEGPSCTNPLSNRLISLSISRIRCSKSSCGMGFWGVSASVKSVMIEAAVVPQWLAWEPGIVQGALIVDGRLLAESEPSERFRSFGGGGDIETFWAWTSVFFFAKKPGTGQHEKNKSLQYSEDCGYQWVVYSGKRDKVNEPKDHRFGSKIHNSTHLVTFVAPILPPISWVFFFLKTKFQILIKLKQPCPNLRYTNCTFKILLFKFVFNGIHFLS